MKKKYAMTKKEYGKRLAEKFMTKNEYTDIGSILEAYNMHNKLKSLLAKLLPMAEDAYKGYVKSGSCHQEFLSEDNKLLLEVRDVLAVLGCSPINTKTNGA